MTLPLAHTERLKALIEDLQQVRSPEPLIDAQSVCASSPVTLRRNSWREGYAQGARDAANKFAALLTEADASSETTEAQLRTEGAGAPKEALNHDGEPLHTGDDDRIDLVSNILGIAEGLDDIEDFDEAIESLKDIAHDARQLNELLVETIARERARGEGAGAPAQEKKR